MQNILLLGLFMSFSTFGMDDDPGKKLLEQNSQVTQVTENLRCAICWEHKAGNHFWKLPNCSHSFCIPCVVQSARVDNVLCALCRKPWVFGGAENELAGPVPDEGRAVLGIVIGVAATILLGGGYVSYRLERFGTFCSILLGLWVVFSNLNRR
jgi:hypothetical protein